MELLDSVDKQSGPKNGFKSLKCYSLKLKKIISVENHRKCFAIINFIRQCENTIGKSLLYFVVFFFFQRQLLIAAVWCEFLIEDKDF